jgi:hypothetical protein
MPLTDARLATVLARLGLSSPPTVDRAGLDRLYGAWCQSVPFDNTRKLIALRSTAPGPLPGIDPVDFLDTWLEHGVGGTCWPSCNAFYTVVVACGFDATRVTASMADLGPPNHGTILVGLDGRDYLVDTSMLLNRAVPVMRDETGIDDDPLKPVEYETVDGAVRLWFEFVRRDEALTSRCLTPCTRRRAVSGRSTINWWRPEIFRTGSWPCTRGGRRADSVTAAWSR